MTYEEKIIWHEFKTRPLTDEEKAEYIKTLGYKFDRIIDCKMPDDGEKILIATNDGCISCDVCSIDEGYYLESISDDWNNVVAWAEMPKYKVEDKTWWCK